MLRVLIAIPSIEDKFACEKLANKRILDHVVASAEKSAKYCNRFSHRTAYSVTVSILASFGSRVAAEFSNVIEGSTFFVEALVDALQKCSADYICVVPANCPLIPSYVISKHISIAVVNNYDWLSNAEEGCRLSPQGTDCTVFSARALKWLLENNHHIKSDLYPSWMKRGFSAGYFNHAKVKLSIDSQEDLERVRKEYTEVEQVLHKAHKIFAFNCIHRF